MPTIELTVAHLAAIGLSVAIIMLIAQAREWVRWASIRKIIRTKGKWDEHVVPTRHDKRCYISTNLWHWSGRLHLYYYSEPDLGHEVAKIEFFKEEEYNPYWVVSIGAGSYWAWTWYMHDNPRRDERISWYGHHQMWRLRKALRERSEVLRTTNVVPFSREQRVA